MGQNGGRNNERRGAQPDGRIIPDRDQHEVCAAVARHVAGPVQPDEEKSGQRQYKQDLWVCRSPIGHKRNGVVKAHTDRPDDHADDAGKKQPPQKRPGIL